jgi:hypothetical protein
VVARVVAARVQQRGTCCRFHVGLAASREAPRTAPLASGSLSSVPAAVPPTAGPKADTVERPGATYMSSQPAHPPGSTPSVAAPSYPGSASWEGAQVSAAPQKREGAAAAAAAGATPAAYMGDAAGAMVLRRASSRAATGGSGSTWPGKKVARWQEVQRSIPSIPSPLR